MINPKQLDKMKNSQGFIAALDQSGGSTPKALSSYGIGEETYSSDEEMFDLVHQMRSRIIKSPSFTNERIIGAILFEQTMNSKIDGKYTGDYLWEEKGIVPFVKTDLGLEEVNNGVQLMREFDLNSLIDQLVERNIFGTKMRSLIHEANQTGIEAVVGQQFAWARKISDKGLVPIIEPEVSIDSSQKQAAEEILLKQINQQLENWPVERPLIFKLTIPSVDGFYSQLMTHPAVVRVVALSGGYERDLANEKLKQNPGLIASFSRAFSQGLTSQQSDQEFDKIMDKSIQEIYQASIV